MSDNGTVPSIEILAQRSSTVLEMVSGVTSPDYQRQNTCGINFHSYNHFRVVTVSFEFNCISALRTLISVNYGS